MNKMLTVFKTGYNGDSDYYLKTKEGEIIYSKMKLADLAKNFVDKYPELSEKIANFYKVCFYDDFPEELDISSLDPTPRENFLKSVSEKFGEKEKGNITSMVKEKNSNKSL